jgi:competence protein ComGC
MNRKMLATFLTLGVILSVATIGINSARADDTALTNPFISKLAEKFGISEDEVEAVFESVRDERHEQMHNMHQNNLNQAVTDGVITEDQLDALQEKHQQMWEERSRERLQHFEEMQGWFDEQGIDHEALMDYMGGFGHRGGGHGMGFLMKHSG